MIKKIFNWTLGSFFRTLGRFLFYIIIGLLLSYILKGLNIKGIFNILDVYADTFELETYNSNYALETNTNHWANTSLEYNEILGMKVIHFYNPNNQVNLGSGTTYIKWNLRFKTKPETGNYNISGAIKIGQVGKFITGASLSNSNSVCTIGEYSQNTSFINFNCENAHIDNQYFSIIFYLGINQTNGYLGTPDISRYLNMERTQQDILTDDNVSQSTNSASNFFNNFSTNTHGLTGIITAPLNAINSLTNSTCSPLVLPLPFVNDDLTLPCMRQIYDDNFGDFMTIYDIITLGIISYWVMVRIFGLVKDFKNPEHDEVEVLDL